MFQANWRRKVNSPWSRRVALSRVVARVTTRLRQTGALRVLEGNWGRTSRGDDREGPVQI